MSPTQTVPQYELHRSALNTASSAYFENRRDYEWPSFN